MFDHEFVPPNPDLCQECGKSHTVQHESLFTPTITLDDDGFVTVDFMGSYQHTYVKGGDGEQDHHDPYGHAAKLDKILGINDNKSGSTAVLLRNLADHIQREEDAASTLLEVEILWDKVKDETAPRRNLLAIELHSKVDKMFETMWFALTPHQKNRLMVIMEWVLRDYFQVSEDVIERAKAPYV